jgi:hypothetical protein
VSIFFAGTFALWACGPFFSRWLLGPERLLVPAPEGILRVEIGRLKLADAPRAVPADNPWQQTSETDLADLGKALDNAQVPAERRGPLVERYTEVRNTLSQYAASTIVFYNVSEPLYPEDGMIGEETNAPELPEKLTVPEGLPGEFTDYLQGAFAYHKGDLDDALSAWNKLLKRPENERHFRSTWAAFMIGKTHLRAERPAEAVRWFERTREIAGQKGFEDSLGLAAASLGWEARAERDLGHWDKALVLYARQARGGDTGANSSLRFVARQAVKAGPDALALVARSAEARSVMNAFLVADGSAPWDEWELDMEEEEGADGEASAAKEPPLVAAWLAALQKAGVKNVEGADRIAWAAYQGGEFAAARQWLDRAPADAPMARWTRAKLLLRDGKLAEAQTLLDQVAATLPAPQLTEDEVIYHTPGSSGGKLATPELAAGESAVLLTTQGKYLDAVDRFLKTGFWTDAAHLAERVLTIDELKTYVDAHWPASLAQDLPDDTMYAEGLQPAPPALTARNLRYLLGRRLIRAGRYDEATPYLLVELEPTLDMLRTDLQQGKDESQPAHQRAAALFRGSCIARKYGLELMGTELGPDWLLYEGQYEVPGDPGDLEGRAKNPHLKPGPGEAQAMERTAPDPDKRFHYRYRAAEIAWEAAGLLPDGSDQKARYLATAGTWLKARDADAARPFYKALLECCSDTKLGKEAQKVRWFPEVPDCEEE